MHQDWQTQVARPLVQSYLAPQIQSWISSCPLPVHTYIYVSSPSPRVSPSIHTANCPCGSESWLSIYIYIYSYARQHGLGAHQKCFNALTTRLRRCEIPRRSANRKELRSSIEAHLISIGWNWPCSNYHEIVSGALEYHELGTSTSYPIILASSPMRFLTKSESLNDDGSIRSSRYLPCLSNATILQRRTD